jgi:hypothetical protein
MTQTQSAETGTAFRTPRPQFPQAAGMPEPAVPPVPLTAAENADADRFAELFAMNGIALTPEETAELKVFEEFLSRHVQPSTVCDVQCMLLWNEWVRVYRRRESGFPNLIRENEFRIAISGKFGVGIATDGWRGAIYPGVRYVP